MLHPSSVLSTTARRAASCFATSLHRRPCRPPEVSLGNTSLSHSNSLNLLPVDFLPPSEVRTLTSDLNPDPTSPSPNPFLLLTQCFPNLETLGSISHPHRHSLLLTPPFRRRRPPSAATSDHRRFQHTLKPNHRFPHATSSIFLTFTCSISISTLNPKVVFPLTQNIAHCLPFHHLSCPEPEPAKSVLSRKCCRFVRAALDVIPLWALEVPMRIVNKSVNQSGS